MKQAMRSVLLALSAALFFCGAAFAAGDRSTDEAFSTYQADEDMTALTARAAPFTPGYGGWVTPLFMDQKAGDTELGIAIVATRVWLRLSLWGSGEIYVRGRHTYQSPVREEMSDGGDAENRFDLDAGFIKLAGVSGSAKLFLGRRFFTIGTGLVLNGRGDGAELELLTSVADIRIMGSYSGLLKKDDNPYNLSDVDIADGARRVFAGGTISRSLLNQTLYVFGLAQVDLADEPSDEPVRYQSQYWGAGLNGVIATDMKYYAEFVYETGTSYLSGADRKEDVRAHAGQFGINWFFSTIFRPALVLQYAYGTGDADRTDNRNPTGNTSGGDSGFLYFGTFNGGYGLRPVLANIHIYRAGIGLSPFSWSRYRTLRRMQIIGKYSYYIKYESTGVINSGEATLDNRDIGQGVDVALKWQILYDFSIFANYGAFLPGDAYEPGEDTRHFITGGATLVF